MMLTKTLYMVICDSCGDSEQAVYSQQFFRGDRPWHEEDGRSSEGNSTTEFVIHLCHECYESQEKHKRS